LRRSLPNGCRRNFRQATTAPLKRAFPCCPRRPHRCRHRG
jgi:hypothetical protein